MFATVQLTEVLWTVPALIGLWFWSANFQVSILALRASRAVEVSAGAKLWARFSALLTAVFMFVEFVFAMTGIVSMTVAPSPTANAGRVWFYAALFIGASVGIAVIALRWRTVHLAFERLTHQGES
jgi:hypothetical protein